MSEESREWLSEMIKIGFTEQRGTAWHYREGDDNHYPGAVPLEVVHKLFDFDIVKEPVTVAGRVDPDTVAWYSYDHDTIFGYFSPGAKPHNYNEWLVGNTGALLGGDLAIGSAGLLDQRKKAFIQAELPENVYDSTTGESIRPTIFGATSLDGTLATIYRIVYTRVVCDNTVRRALSEDGAYVRVKHTRFSELRVADAQETLGLLTADLDEMLAEMHQQAAQPVSERQFARFMDLYIPVPAETGRGRTMAENRRDALMDLYRTDERVAPWSGTVWGVRQAVNTYNHHLRTIRKGAPRFERNAMNVAKGTFDEDELNALVQLERAMA